MLLASFLVILVRIQQNTRFVVKASDFFSLNNCKLCYTFHAFAQWLVVLQSKVERIICGRFFGNKDMMCVILVNIVKSLRKGDRLRRET